jgi:hypothetical protein
VIEMDKTTTFPVNGERKRVCHSKLEMLTALNDAYEAVAAAKAWAASEGFEINRDDPLNERLRPAKQDLLFALSDLNAR